MNKNSSIAVRLSDSFRFDVDNAADDIGVNVSTLARWMMSYCMRLSDDGSSWIPKSDFLSYAERQKARTLF